MTGEEFGADLGSRPRFHGSAGDMFPMVMKGLFLTVVTLGVYRFWYVTNVRRFLWNNSEIDGDFAEYTGRGVELFIGFLIALAVLIPLYGLLFLAALYMGPGTAEIINGLSTLAIIFLAQYALFRARRYRLTRTVWRGIRFQQSGSGWAYAWRSLGWALLVILTLGLAYPFMRASLERYKMTHTWYGDQQGGFTATGGQLFKRSILVWIAFVLLIGGLGGGAAMVAATLPKTGDPMATHWAFGLVPLVVLPALAIIIPVYWAIEYKWWANGCSVGPATARCDLGLFAFFKVYLGYLGVAILFALAVGIIGFAAAAALKGSGVLNAAEAGPAQFGVMAVLAVLYVLVALAFAALWQIFGVRPIWRKSLESVELFGLGALTAAQSTEPEANAFGEGVADALDFGGF